MKATDFSLRLELGTYGQSLHSQISIPYWFTSDGLIHMAAGVNPVLQIADLREVKPQHIYQIGHAVDKGELVADNKEMLFELFNIVLNGKPEEIAPQVEQSIKQPVSSAVLDALKIRQISDEAKELIGQSQVKIVNLVGSDEINDSILSTGIVDVDLLTAALELEKNSNKRKNVVTCLTKRLKAIELVGINITPESGLEVTDTDEYSLEIDGNSGTISTISTEEK